MREYFKEMVEEMDRFDSGEPLPTKGVTVRLDYLVIAHIDQLAEETNKSRQWILETLLEAAIPSAVRGLVDARGPTSDKRVEMLKELNEDIKDRAVSMASEEGITLDLKGWVVRTTLEEDEALKL